MTASNLRRVLPAALFAVTVPLAGCAGQDTPAATPPALLHTVPDLCQRLDHGELRELAEPVGTPRQMPSDDRSVRCGVTSGALNSESLATLMLSTIVKPTAADAAGGVPTADPVSNSDFERGQLDGLGERATIIYSSFEADLDVGEVGTAHESYDLTTLDGNAVVMVMLKLGSGQHVGPAVLERIARGYTQQALDLMRAQPAG